MLLPTSHLPLVVWEGNRGPSLFKSTWRMPREVVTFGLFTTMCRRAREVDGARVWRSGFAFGSSVDNFQFSFRFVKNASESARELIDGKYCN